MTWRQSVEGAFRPDEAVRDEGDIGRPITRWCKAKGSGSVAIHVACCNRWMHKVALNAIYMGSSKLTGGLLSLRD
jgi:hypothetical protein